MVLKEQNDCTARRLLQKITRMKATREEAEGCFTFLFNCPAAVFLCSTQFSYLLQLLNIYIYI